MKARLLFAFLLLSCLTASTSAQQPSAVMPKKHAAFFRKYCLDCHDAETREGKVDLENLPFDLGQIETAERWQKVLNALNSGEMPPQGEPRAKAAEKTELLADLSHRLVAARKILGDSGGVITMRRLNRREYENTMRSLLGVDVDAGDLPQDGGAGSFDTAGASLFFSSDQFEQYVKIARRALDEAIVVGPRPSVRRPKIEAETASAKQVRKQYNRLLDSHRRAEQWRKSDKPPTAFGFIDEARVKFEDGNYKRWGPTFLRYLEHPASQSGAVMFNWFQGAHVVPVTLPPTAAPGKYLLRVRAAALDDAPPQRRFLEFGLMEQGAQTGELRLQGCRQVTGTMAEPQVLEIPITISKSGVRRFGFRERQHNIRDAARFAFRRSQLKTGYGPDPALWIDWVQWEGPLLEQWPPQSHQQIFFGGPQAKKTDAYARQIIQRFAVRAFRIKEPSKVFVDKLLELYRGRRQLGESFVEALKEPLSVVLASPSFLYLSEPTGDRDKRKLTDLELAVRLSYFLWSAPPDEELYTVARRGELSDSQMLWRQADRMMREPRAWEFIRGFTHQWLGMDRLDFFQFNYRLYPEFDDSVKNAARLEVYHTFQTILRQNGGVGELLKSDYVVVNDLLANYYGLPNVHGDHFRKVRVPAGSPRGGLLGMAATLAMGSDGERSSLVERGAWVMRKLLNNPPPPAPANVPQLSRHANKLLPARKLLAAHTEEPQCAQCHRKIDPIGYGLENFDAAGRWRDEERTEIAGKRAVKRTKLHPIDPSGSLPDGAAFANYQELRERVAEREDAFARSFTEALIAYGLGRPYGFSDQDLADKIQARAREKDNRMKVFIHALIQSRAFRTK